MDRNEISGQGCAVLPDRASDPLYSCHNTPLSIAAAWREGLATQPLTGSDYFSRRRLSITPTPQGLNAHRTRSRPVKGTKEPDADR